MHYCYILFSKTLNRYYCGSTELSPEERLKMHNTQHYGNTKFTAKVNDWEMYFTIQCKSIEQARNIEAFIKRMKSKTYIIKLKTYPEKINWLLTNL